MPAKERKRGREKRRSPKRVEERERERNLGLVILCIRECSKVHTHKTSSLCESRKIEGRERMAPGGALGEKQS